MCAEINGWHNTLNLSWVRALGRNHNLGDDALGSIMVFSGEGMFVIKF